MRLIKNGNTRTEHQVYFSAALKGCLGSRAKGVYPKYLAQFDEADRQQQLHISNEMEE